MHKWFSPLISLIAITGLQAQHPIDRPKLVISIVVDQLRGDYLQYFSSTFGEKGFKRLMQEGLFYHSVDFGFPNLSQASSTAAIYTGSYPYYNGIIGDTRFDFNTNGEISIVSDEHFMGNYTSNRVSPLALLSSTVGDELKIASQGQGKVYSIAPNAEEAILSGGKYANCAFWLDEANGKWATSTYYKDIPGYVDNYNASDAIGNYPEKQWDQSHAYYNGLPYATSLSTPFSYRFTKTDKDRYTKIKQTSLMNMEVTKLAGRFLENAGFTRNLSSDLLTLTYYAGNYTYNPNQDDYSYEIQDIYYRLDKEIENLLDLIDRKVGLKHTLILLTSTGYYDAVQKPSKKFKPAGEFHPNRCTSLLNMYLMAIYGQGNWVTGYFNQQLFLNKKLVEDKKVDGRELLRHAAEFTNQFSGVQEVTTSAEPHRGMNKNLSGDIFIELQPGWVIVNEKHSEKPQYTREKAIQPPLFIFGENIRKEQVFRPVKATEIAATLCYILRIRPPTACKEFPLQEIITN